MPLIRVEEKNIFFWAHEKQFSALDLRLEFQIIRIVLQIQFYVPKREAGIYSVHLVNNQAHSWAMLE